MLRLLLLVIPRWEGAWSRFGKRFSGLRVAATGSGHQNVHKLLTSTTLIRFTLPICCNMLVCCTTLVRTICCIKLVCCTPPIRSRCNHLLLNIIGCNTTIRRITLTCRTMLVSSICCLMLICCSPPERTSCYIINAMPLGSSSRLSASAVGHLAGHNHRNPVR